MVLGQIRESELKPLQKQGFKLTTERLLSVMLLRGLQVSEVGVLSGQGSALFRPRARADRQPSACSAYATAQPPGGGLLSLCWGYAEAGVS